MCDFDGIAGLCQVLHTSVESLKEALDEMETSDLMKETLGETAFENFLTEKRKEWDLYRMQVTEWEVNRYIKRL